MIIFKDSLDIYGNQSDVAIESEQEIIIDAKGLLKLPALIDPHVHFRTPGQEYKEDWLTGAQAALFGGITTVFDMPNNLPPIYDLETIKKKKCLIDAQLKKASIPLRYGLYLAADKTQIEKIPQAKSQAVGIKVFMGSSTGDLLIEEDEVLEKIFRIASKNNMIVAIHAECEKTLKNNSKRYPLPQRVPIHSRIRSKQAALIACKKALFLSKKYNCRLYLLHVSTQEELQHIRQAKKENVPVYVECCPHHLFFNISYYQSLGTKALVNPPLRDPHDQKALWKAIEDGTVDTIGSDHAPHALEEKMQTYGKAPSGIAGIEFMLPLLLNAYHDRKISLEKIVEITRKNVEKIFNLKSNDDLVFVDMEQTLALDEKDLKTKCRLSPYTDVLLKGWPIYTVLDKKVYSVDRKQAAIPLVKSLFH